MNKKMVLVTMFAILCAACHVASKEDPTQDDAKVYEAIGLLTIPTSGFKKEDVRTKVVLVDKQKLDIYMFEVKFATLMPVTIDMVIRGVDYKQTTNGIQFYGDSIVPTAGEKPYEKYVVRDLQGRITPDSMIITNNYGETPSRYAGKLKK